MENVILNGETILYKTTYISKTNQKDLIKILEKEIDMKLLFRYGNIYFFR